MTSDRQISAYYARTSEKSIKPVNPILVRKPPVTRKRTAAFVPLTHNLSLFDLFKDTDESSPS